MSSSAQSRAPSRMSGLDVAGLLNRLLDRQHDDFQQAVHREQSARAEAKAEVSQAFQREKEARAEACQREKKAKAEAYQREQAAKADAYQREKEVIAMAKAEALQGEKQVRSEERDRNRPPASKVVQERSQRTPAAVEFSEPPGWNTYSYGG